MCINKDTDTKKNIILLQRNAKVTGKKSCVHHFAARRSQPDVPQAHLQFVCDNVTECFIILDLRESGGPLVLSFFNWKHSNFEEDANAEEHARS